MIRWQSAGLPCSWLPPAVAADRCGAAGESANQRAPVLTTTSCAAKRAELQVPCGATDVSSQPKNSSLHSLQRPSRAGAGSTQEPFVTRQSLPWRATILITSDHEFTARFPNTGCLFQPAPPARQSDKSVPSGFKIALEIYLLHVQAVPKLPQASVCPPLLLPLASHSAGTAGSRNALISFVHALDGQPRACRPAGWHTGTARAGEGLFCFRGTLPAAAAIPATCTDYAVPGGR